MTARDGEDSSSRIVGQELVTSATLLIQLERYLLENPAAVILEDGRVAFEMRTARYSISDAHGRCLLQLWSEERNLVRTVVGMQQRARSLRLTTRRMGHPKPQTLELVASVDRRTPSMRDTARRNYGRLLERVLTRRFPGTKVEGMRSAMDLEHSFGPAYTRGRLLRGTEAEAVIGTGSSESSSAIDGTLTLGLLWLDYCRQHSESRRHVSTLLVVVPAGCARTTAERMAWLNHTSAGFQLFTLDERSEELEPVDIRDTGNLELRLVHSFSRQAAVDRCRAGLDKLLTLVPASDQARVEIYSRSPGEVGLLLHGLEFARVRSGVASTSFQRQEEITFGAGANETPLTPENEDTARALFTRLFASRRPQGQRNDPLFRLQPERWLESLLRAHIERLSPGLRGGPLLYSQVPALASTDRAMLDLLTLDSQGRLHVIEVKADEDLHLPLQALDYWIRVRALNDDRRGTTGGRPLSAFERHAYFPGAEVAEAAPRLLLVGPALRIHPANETVLRYLSPKIEWELIALAEHWRNELQVVFRKRNEA